MHVTSKHGIEVLQDPEYGSHWDRAEPENLASSSGVGIGLPITARPYPVSLGEPPAQGLVQFERMAGSTPPAGSPVRDVMKDLPEAPA